VLGGGVGVGFCGKGGQPRPRVEKGGNEVVHEPDCKKWTFEPVYRKNQAFQREGGEVGESLKGRDKRAYDKIPSP